MDFSLREKNPSFNLDTYLDTVNTTLHSFDLEVDVVITEKQHLFSVQSAFQKGNGVTHLIQISAPQEMKRTIPSNELIKIKLEIDTAPLKEPHISRNITYAHSPVSSYCMIFPLCSQVRFVRSSVAAGRKE